jgi:hypothetical protein
MSHFTFRQNRGMGSGVKGSCRIYNHYIVLVKPIANCIKYEKKIEKIGN